MFHAEAADLVHVEGGRGGDGVVCFRREAHVPRGGPDGGDGGRGGDVIVVCDPSRRDLAALRHSPHLRAGRGAHGQGAQQARRPGRGSRFPCRRAPRSKASRASATTSSSRGSGRSSPGAAVGGHGNKRFAISTRQAPRFAETRARGRVGLDRAAAAAAGRRRARRPAERRQVVAARPPDPGGAEGRRLPVHDVEPVLGTLETDDRQLVLADIPGLIEGAADGRRARRRVPRPRRALPGARPRRRAGAAGGIARSGRGLRDRPRGARRRTARGSSGCPS